MAMPKIKMYVTGACPYCHNAKSLLARKGVDPADIEEIRVDLAPDRLTEMRAATGLRTVPQIYIGDRHIGGFNELAALDRAGTLNVLLNIN